MVHRGEKRYKKLGHLSRESSVCAKEGMRRARNNNSKAAVDSPGLYQLASPASRKKREIRADVDEGKYHLRNRRARSYREEKGGDW